MTLRCLLIIISVIGLQACQHAIDINTNDIKLNEAAIYNTQLGLGYLSQGNREKAKHKLLIAMNQAPTSAPVNAAMAHFWEESAELKKAQYYYQRALRLAPSDGAQLNNYGAFLCRMGNYKEADSYFLKAINDTTYEHTAGAYENAGLCAQEDHQIDKASVYYVKSLKLDPSREQSLYELVKIKVKQGKLNQALSYLKEYPRLTHQHQHLLKLALDVAQKAGKIELEVDYNAQLNHFSEQTGGNDEYNINKR